MREEIRKRQNSDWALDRLAAQRLLYRQVKFTENWRLILILLVAVLLLSGLALETGPFSQGATMAVVFLWFIDQVVLVPWVGRRKEEAAAIQEDFDCCVLDIPWPDHLGVGRPTGDRVNALAESAQRSGEKRKDLANWYRAEDIPEDPLKARLHCQRVNCHWDSRLRGDWICWVRFAVGVIVVGGRVGATRIDDSGTHLTSRFQNQAVKHGSLLARKLTRWFSSALLPPARMKRNTPGKAAGWEGVDGAFELEPRVSAKSPLKRVRNLG